MSNYRIRFKGDPSISEGSSDFLMHFGIKGQKWGVRRFQEEDGTYTAAGRERYGIGKNIDESAKSNFFKKTISRMIKKKDDKHTADNSGDGNKLTQDRLLNDDDRIQRDFINNYRSLKLFKKQMQRDFPSEVQKESKRYDALAEFGLEPSDDYIKQTKVESDAETNILAASTMSRLDKAIESYSKTKKNDPEYENARKEWAEASKDAVRLASKFKSDGEREFSVHEMSLNGSLKNDPEKLAKAQNHILRQLTDPNTADDWGTTRNLLDAKKEGYEESARAYLIKQMREKSGDWYYGESKTEGHRKLCKELDKCYDEYNRKLGQIRSKYSGDKLEKALAKDTDYQAIKKKEQKLIDDLMGQVLRDIGWPDTPENRKQALYFAYREH